MPITDDVQIPTYEELDVQEINISQPVLKASAMHFGKYCDHISKEFMLCKIEERDPRRCLNEGKAVTACGLEFYRKVKNNCRNELEKLSKCMEWTDYDMKFLYCRKEQSCYDQCMSEKLGINRPPLGYFTQLRVHQTDRPKPGGVAPRFNDPSVPLPEDFPMEESKYGWRDWWWF
ncbi:NADH dehydrogenase [ubiquinone] 1 alpha subcomplex subunit 8-like [Oppia nitens]|uniref:NADH dehydrogenase [ubiquinone] 1 alpha subcomplex subunit 8-like n=1 Tax=Oppia nitens TaxID=1686743 RepID=UPI0023DB4992|nr:NADH dehydrogenase [ubiquinone] 1 alpha subcomplex subunit 8-like [Oppia nitens]